MKKQKTIGAIVITTIATTGSFMWLPDAIADFRHYMTKPSIESQEKMESRLMTVITTLKLHTNQTMMAMKYFDIRTDEVTKDVSDMQDLIDFAEDELLQEPDLSRKVKIKQRLEHYRGIQHDHKEKLDEATDGDQKLLARLSAYDFNNDL